MVSLKAKVSGSSTDQRDIPKGLFPHKPRKNENACGCHLQDPILRILPLEADVIFPIWGNSETMLRRADEALPGCTETGTKP